MKVIWKYTLDTPKNEIKMPIKAKVLHVGGQLNIVCIWVEVRPGPAKEIRRFTKYETGDELPSDPGKYLGTAKLRRGHHIVHVYED